MRRVDSKPADVEDFCGKMHSPMSSKQEKISNSSAERKNKVHTKSVDLLANEDAY